MVEGSGRRSLPSVPLEPLLERDPREVAGFRLLGRLGAGGMGVAFLADGLGQWAVVKVIRSELADDPGFRSRVARELDAVGRLDGQSARVLADGLGDAVPWFAMEFIEGQTLDHRVRDRGPLRDGDLVGFAAGLAGVLAGVHAAGIVHRDIKPSNVMMSPSGPRLIDFGIAEVDEGTQLTRTGSVMGSLGWLAPEQVRGDATGPATDVHAWALCVVFAATGDAPFGSDTSAAAMYRVLEATPQVPESVPEPLRGLLQGALAKEPARRPTLDQVHHGLGMPAPAAPRWSDPVLEAGTFPTAAAATASWPDTQTPEVKAGISETSHHHERRNQATGAHRYRTLISAAVVVLGLLLAVTVGVRVWLGQQWYVAINGSPGTGTIAIYNGLPENFLGFDLSTLRSDSGLPVGSLPLLLQETVKRTMPANSSYDAQRIVGELRTAAQGCQSPTPPAGCPGAIGG